MRKMSKQILIVDDSKTFLMFVGLLLKRLDFMVIPAENGLEAIKLLKVIEPDLVILDVHMEAIDGFKVLQHIKSEKQTSHIPVIMISSDSSGQTREQCVNLGCDEYLLKPLKIDELNRVLQKMLFSRHGTDRNLLRIPFKRQIAVDYSGKRGAFFSETLSEGGIYLITENPLPPGTEVKVTVPLNEGVSVQSDGTVIYIKELFSGAFKLPPGMAIAFKGLPQQEVDTLKNYIIDSLTEGIREK